MEEPNLDGEATPAEDVVQHFLKPEETARGVPIINVGRYAGTPIEQLPNSYLRWMVGQDFPEEWVELALKKLAASSYDDSYLSLSRHAIDMYSKRFLYRWLPGEARRKDGDGIATFLVKQAERAWNEGLDVSKHRHQDDGIVKALDGVLYVFHVSEKFPDYKELITVMSRDRRD